jgi:hypothetical protein
MNGLLAMRAQLCSQAVKGVEPVGDDGDDGVLIFFFFFELIIPKRLLRSEAFTKRLKKDKERKVIILEVFMVDLCFAEANERQHNRQNGTMQSTA